MQLRRQVREDVEVRYKIASLILLTATFFLAAAAWSEAVEVNDLARRGQVADAEVIGLLGRSSVIEVRFTTQRGQPVTARTSRYGAQLKRGDRLRVEYDPSRLDRIQEQGWGEDYSVAIMFGISTAVTGVLGLGCVLRRWPQRIERPLWDR